MLHLVKWYHHYFLIFNDNGMAAITAGDNMHEAFCCYFESAWNTSEQPSRAMCITYGCLHDEFHKHPVILSIDGTDISSAKQLFNRYPELLI